MVVLGHVPRSLAGGDDEIERQECRSTCCKKLKTPSVDQVTFASAQRGERMPVWCHGMSRRLVEAQRHTSYMQLVVYASSQVKAKRETAA